MKKNMEHEMGTGVDKVLGVFKKIRVHFWGVIVKRTTVFGSPSFGKLPCSLSNLDRCL